MRNQSRFGTILTFALCLSVISACGSDGPTTLFPPRPACTDTPMVPRSGDHTMVISRLEIGQTQDGFDLDHDGSPDNKFAGLGSFAGLIVDPAATNFSTILAIEFFDYPSYGPDECVQFAMYLSDYSLDSDGDSFVTAEAGGDCDDNDPNINPGAAEVAGDGKDNNCDGVADEGNQTGNDSDGDGVTVAAGDCNDNLDTVALGFDEVCGDGLDNDCDGVADFGTPVCTPFDPDTPDALLPQAVSFNMDGSPKIAFAAGSTALDPDTSALKLEAGPALFSLLVEIIQGLSIDFRITGTQIDAEVIDGASGIGLQSARLGGVLDANTLDKITGIDVPDYGILPENTLLDAVFVNPILVAALGLQKNADNCAMPDVDVDLDGIEAFCDSNPLDTVNTIDTCIDGDGTVVMDGAQPCTEAVGTDGKLRFVDGISIEMNFEAVAATLR